MRYVLGAFFIIACITGEIDRQDSKFHESNEPNEWSDGFSGAESLIKKQDYCFRESIDRNNKNDNSANNCKAMTTDEEEFCSAFLLNWR